MPLLAVAHELKLINPDCRIVYVGERNSKFATLTKDNPDIDEVRTVMAGKYRRYYGEPLISRIFDIKTNLLNARDLVYFAIGTVQSWLLLGQLKPSVILLKGGFVGVPVGLAAAARKQKFVTHDSDVIPGLANRLVGRWASLHAVALPPSEYRYPEAKTKQVGVIIDSRFNAVNDGQKQQFLRQLGLPDNSKVLLVTGGSSGAQRINEALVKIADNLLADYPDLHIVHQAGRGKTDVYGQYQNPRLQILEFMSPMYAYTGCADVAVTRASANTLAELGAQGKACIVIASRFLADGHQLKNAERLASAQAAITITEDKTSVDAAELDKAIRGLLNNADERKKLALTLQKGTITDAAHKLAVLLLDLSDAQKKN